MSYVDGFVVPVPTDNQDAYLAFAKAAAPVFKDHGALKVMECWGDDVPAGEVTSFPLAVKLEANETVVFSFIVWPSKQVRDAGIEKAMNDPRLAPFAEDMPFNGRRMIMGGFNTLLEA